MELLTNNSSFMLEKTMGFLWSRQAAILDNIANAETPNYKAKDVTFEGALQERLALAAGTEKPRASVRQALETSGAVTRRAQEITRMDGNGVNVTEENLELARVGYQLQYLMQSISMDFNVLRTAIRGQ